MRLILAVLLSAALVAVGVPAHADRITIKDPAHDHVPPGGSNFKGLGDVVRVKVDHAPRRVFVDTRFRTGPYDELSIDIDTRKARKGREFTLLKTPFGVTLWRAGRDKPVACADKRVKYLKKKRTWAAHVNRGCLRWPRKNGKRGDTPRQVRVRLLSSSDDGYFTLDRVPGKKRWSRWVRHN